MKLTSKNVQIKRDRAGKMLIYLFARSEQSSSSCRRRWCSSLWSLATASTTTAVSAVAASLLCSQ